MQNENLNVNPEIDNNPTPSNQQQPVYYPVYAARPKIPGKGFGITSMILGIYGAVCSAVLLLISLQATLLGFTSQSSGSTYDNFKTVMESVFTSGDSENVVGMIFGSLVMAILACVFALLSRKRGYRNGISQSGLILSVVSFAAVLVFSFTGKDILIEGLQAGFDNANNNTDVHIIGEWEAAMESYGFGSGGYTFSDDKTGIRTFDDAPTTDFKWHTKTAANRIAIERELSTFAPNFEDKDSIVSIGYLYIDIDGQDNTGVWRYMIFKEDGEEMLMTIGESNSSVEIFSRVG
ncbi:MAG: hypothetical protein FWH14_02375 [Oscillospiraceae bacterium]|nr:hypothetical protein [Oscillospiraceae bacterium]